MGALDVSYFIAESLATDDRRAHERALLERYHAGLVAGGVTDYSFDQLYDHYRLSLLTQLSIPVIGSSMDPGNERGMRLFDATVARLLHRDRRSRCGAVPARLTPPMVRT